MEQQVQTPEGKADLGSSSNTVHTAEAGVVSANGPTLDPQFVAWLESPLFVDLPQRLLARAAWLHERGHIKDAELMRDAYARIRIATERFIPEQMA